MDMNHKQTKIVRVLLSISLSVVLILGCTGSQKDKESKDPFFEEWQARSEESKGFSLAPPRVGQKPVEITEKVAPKIKKVEKGKSLPTRKISLKMTDIDVSVLLRALARAANQNIIVSERVRGKININITQAPWNQVFLGILRTHGLSYDWEGEIIRIMTSDDMEDDLKREARQRELLITEAPLTRIVPIRYAAADGLKTNLDNFLTVDNNGSGLSIMFLNA
jgi:type IV pilus assembly protein PilQ